MTKQETAKQIVSQVVEFLEDNEYLDYRLVQISKAAVKRESEILDDDLEQLQDIAQDSIEEFMGYVAKGTLRSK